MVSTDPIADMLTRIRNALAVRQDVVKMPHSKIKQSVAEVLAKNDYVVSAKVRGSGIEKELVISITEPLTSSPITEITRISKPGRRVYADVKSIPRIKQGRGLVVMSTSKGIMTGHQAKKQKLGGEVLCSIY